MQNEQLEQLKINLEKNVASIKKHIPNSIEILAATKSVSVGTINALASAGIFVAGENRVQEFLSKVSSVDKSIKWHFIGSLQTNKVKYIVDKVECINSVDRETLALEINRQCEKINKIMPVLLQINGGQEQAKSGVAASELDSLYNFIIKNCPYLKIVGLMPVLPINATEKLYANMQRLFVEFSKNSPNIKTLSMGMSSDYQIAIKYGATQIRLGSILFGERGYK